MLKFFFSILFVLTFWTICKSQSSGWTNVWEPLYSDSYITVEVQFYIPGITVCQTNGKEFKYKYRVKGRYRNSAFYLNWKLDYVECNGELTYQNNSLEIGKSGYDDISNWVTDESLEYVFPAESLDTKFYDQQVGSSRLTGRGTKARPKSTAPKGIDGARKIYLGEEIELTVNGGVLGVNAQWEWYEGSCDGKQLERGKSIKISPKETTKIFVRAVGKNNTTPCVEATIEVDKRSQAPTGVTGRENICKGEPVTLTVSGGTLGQGAKWVWYSGSCGGNKIGEGRSFSGSPSVTTQYFVRAEGALNTTNCAGITVSVNGKSFDPVSASVSSSAICEGQSIKLNVKGGTLSADGVWQWYEGNCGGKSVGQGVTVSISPSYSTTYYVRGEGVCNSTKCVSVPVNVDRNVPNSYSITASADVVLKKGKTKLSVSGGSLPAGSQWQWFKGSCGGDKIGTGSSIHVHPKANETYFVTVAGRCNSNYCAQKSISVTPRRADRFYTTNQKYLHYGFGVGLLEWIGFHTLADTFNYGQELIGIQGLGLPAEFMFHPYMKENFSIGLQAAGAVGTTPSFGAETEKEDGTVRKEGYFYYRWNIGAEAAFGFKVFKLLYTINRSSQKNNYSRTDNYYGSITNYEYNGTMDMQTNGLGFRIGRYLKYRGGSTFDVLYTFTERSPSEFVNFNIDGGADRFQGMSLMWWKLSKFKLKFDIQMPEPGVTIFESDWTDPSFQLSLVLNWSRFY